MKETAPRRRDAAGAATWRRGAQVHDRPATSEAAGGKEQIMAQETSRRTFIGMAAGAGAAIGLTPIARADAEQQSIPRKVPQRLKILVLGGTGQTGPHFIQRALAHGHDVTMFNRGRRSDDMFPDVECLVGNRFPDQDEGLRALEAETKAGRHWDVVLDVWPHIPKLVEATADLLKDHADRYMFVSSLSVYVDNATKNQDESAEVGKAPDADNMEFNWELFGPFKAECENRVRRFFPDRNTIFRPGLIVGPRDRSHRGVYWPLRVRKGGEVLAPGNGKGRIQNIDGRDLVAFELHCMERGIQGTFNVVGPHPHNPLTMEQLLVTCKRATGSDATFTWVPADFLAAHEVGPWMQMPNWLPAEGEYAGFGTRNVDKAVAAGLTFRPMTETIIDTLQWFDELSEEDQMRDRQRAGISAEKETQVLQAWKNRESDAI
jgi:2'-hydroxyisoflavone reductase